MARGLYSVGSGIVSVPMLPYGMPYRAQAHTAIHYAQLESIHMASQKELAEQLAAMQAQLEAANKRAEAAEAAKAAAEAAKAAEPQKGISFKVAAKGGISIYGLQRSPVTLYAGQFHRLFEHIGGLQAFILTNADAVQWKTPEAKAEALAFLRSLNIARTEAPKA